MLTPDKVSETCDQKNASWKTKAKYIVCTNNKKKKSKTVHDSLRIAIDAKNG